MELTKRQEKRLNKVFNDPKQLRKWIDEVYNQIVIKCREENSKLIDDYLDIYSIAVAFTLRYKCGFGKKRLPEIMEAIWNNIECFKDGYLSIEDCINELKENGISFDGIVKDDETLKRIMEQKVGNFGNNKIKVEE